MAERWKRPPLELLSRIEIDIHCFSTWRSALNRQGEKQADKFTCGAVGKGI